jgi:hypothetical protein
MTYEPSLDDQPITYAPPPTRRGGLAIIFIVAGVVAVVLVGVILYVGGVLPGGGVSKESAQRACRTAFSNEWKARQARATGGKADILANVNSVELQETWEAKDGWSVNGTVHYMLTTALVAPVQGSIDLTCTATGDDDSPTTTVTNRG